MKLIDLTHTFNWPMPVYPGEPEPSFSDLTSLKANGYLDVEVTTGLHVGTHIDAPAHMIRGGKRLSDYPIDRFIGRGVLVDARNKSHLDGALLQDIDLQAGDIVLVLTGWSQWYRGAASDLESVHREIPKRVRDDKAAERYFTAYPVIEASFVDRLAVASVSMLGLDTPSPDEFTSDEELEERGSAEGLYPIHHQLFESDILIAENLNHLDQLANITEYEVMALPTKFAADAAPARVIARVMSKE